MRWLRQRCLRRAHVVDPATTYVTTCYNHCNTACKRLQWCHCPCYAATTDRQEQERHVFILVIFCRIYCDFVWLCIEARKFVSQRQHRAFRPAVLWQFSRRQGFQIWHQQHRWWEACSLTFGQKLHAFALDTDRCAKQACLWRTFKRPMQIYMKDFHSSHIFFQNSTIWSLSQKDSFDMFLQFWFIVITFFQSRYLLSLISAVRELERFAVGRAQVRGWAQGLEWQWMGNPASAGMGIVFFLGGECFENGLSLFLFVKFIWIYVVFV